MKIKIDRKILVKALAETAPFAPLKPTIPILRNAKITTKGNRMKIEAHNTQSSIVKYIELVECDEDGSFLIDIIELYKFIAKTKGDYIELNIEGNTIHIIHSNGSADFQLCNPIDFPSFKMPQEDIVELHIDSDILAEAVSNGKKFVKNDPVRPQLASIYTYIKDAEFGYCATDTCKLIHWHCNYLNEVGFDTHWYIIPSVFLPLMNACKTAQNVTVQITPTHVSYRLGNTIIQTLQPKVVFPNFKRVIPQAYNFECAIENSELGEALSRLSLFCDVSQRVKFDISRLDMTVSVDNIEYMKSAKENVAHSGCNGEIKIFANINNIITALSVFGNSQSIMCLTDASRPILFKRETDDTLQVCVMPMA